MDIKTLADLIETTDVNHFHIDRLGKNAWIVGVETEKFTTVENDATLEGAVKKIAKMLLVGRESQMQEFPGMTCHVCGENSDDVRDVGKGNLACKGCRQATLESLQLG